MREREGGREEKIMRSGPATQTAFACVNSFCRTRALPSNETAAVTSDHFSFTAICGGASALESAVAPNRALPACSPAMRDRVLRRPQRPGTRNACTLWEPLGNSPSRTAAEPALRDHWQRIVHACSDCNVSHSGIFSNKKSRVTCAKTVDVMTCLWKGTEKRK